ncbi:polysaccharide biosynthesis protein [Nitrobacter hamburgensis X14]|uniref:Polysaccharide biosynthesis protein n=2 Tax=Nitrobacter hamburgensis TaxID=912 RepID=Q1QJ12_NITHX|nr:polysaccharide biosynthesis protein [Nitrobacter hamburgensis X14]
MFFLLLSIAILSRLLTPEEFGVFAIVNALTTVTAASFQEFGGANYLIQKSSLSRRNIRTSFTITFCMSILIGALLFAIKDDLAAFFGQQALATGIAVSVLNFLLWPLSITVSALFRRDMEFGALAVCNLTANFITAVVSIVLAMMSYSYMAPIWGTVVGNVILAVFLILWRREFGLFRPSLAGYRDVFAFGFYSSGVAIINVFYSFAPQLILARTLNLAAVGLYSRAVSVTQIFDRMVVQVLSPVIMPAIFSHTKAGGDLKTVYLTSVELLSSVQWPFLMFVAIMAHPLILVWLGPTWLEIVPLVRLLCIGYLALFAACLTYPVLVAVGRVRDALTASLISLPPSLLLISVASFYGVEAVAATALVALPFQTFVAIYYISRHIGMSFSEFFRATVKSAAVALCSSAGALLAALAVQLGLVGSGAGLIAGGILAGAGWLLGLFLTGHPLLNHLRAAAKELRFALPRSGFAAGGAVARSAKKSA